MSYIGKVDMNDANIKHYSLTSSTLTTVDIGWVPPSEQSLRVTINGVVQQGGSFSLSGSNLTLGGPLVATDDLEVIGIQSVGNIITPADNSVTTTKLADDSVTLAKMAGLARGKIIVGDASGDPSALTVGASTQVLTSDGTDAAWAAPAAGETNTPAWHVGINSLTQAIPDATMTIVELDDVKFDTGFTWDTANYKGIPGTAGKYLIGCSAYVDPSVSTAGNVFFHLFKNTAGVAYWGFADNSAIHYEDVIYGSTIVDLGATDYVQLKVYIDIASGSTNLLQYSATQCVTYMFGMKLIGA